MRIIIKDKDAARNKLSRDRNRYKGDRKLERRNKRDRARFQGAIA